MHREPSLQIGSLKRSSAAPATTAHTRRGDLALISIPKRENILQHSLQSVLMSKRVTPGGVKAGGRSIVRPSGLSTACMSPVSQRRFYISSSIVDIHDDSK